MRTPTTFTIGLIAMLGAVALLLTGCDESVNPVLGTNQAFTLYGYINPKADTQAIRVFPVEGELAFTRPEPIDAQMTSNEMESGQQQIWQDSVVSYGDAGYGHVYWSAFRPDHARTYRLSVRRSDGVATEVEVTTPPPVSLSFGPPVAANRNVLLPVIWTGAPRLLQVEVHYLVEAKSVFANDSSLVLVTIPYDGEQVRVPGGWEITVDLSRDFGTIANRLGLQPGRDDLFLLNIENRALVINEGWNPPGGVYDPEVLVEPGTFSNVENGFGFVGGGYPESIHWLPDETTRRFAGFDVKEE